MRVLPTTVTCPPTLCYLSALMSLPATAPESQHPQTATVDRAPLAAEEELHQPFVPASQDIPELTPVPLVVGALLGILFGASSMYLVLKRSEERRVGKECRCGGGAGVVEEREG